MVLPSLALLALLQMALRLAFLAANRRARRAGWSRRGGCESARHRIALHADAYMQSHPRGPGFFYDYALAANLVLATAAAAAPASHTKTDPAAPASLKKSDRPRSAPMRLLHRLLHQLLGALGCARPTEAPSAELVAAVAESEPREEGTHYLYVRGEHAEWLPLEARVAVTFDAQELQSDA